MIKTSTSQWVNVGRLDDIPVRGARVIKTAAGCIAVFRTAENQAYALDDRCPHKGGQLSQGIVHGTSVTCPLHNWVISLESGVAQGADLGRVRSHPLKIENGKLLLDVTALNARNAAA
jgi:nitrite reductase (NADH) small subunit